MENMLGIYYAFLAASDEVDWLDCLARAKAAELDILEISVPKVRMLLPAARDKIANRAAHLALSLTFATALTTETDISSDDPAIRAAGVRQMNDDLQMIADMGGLSMGGILTGVGKNFPLGIEHRRGDAVRNAISALCEVVTTAEKLKVNLGVEVVNRFESPLVNTCEEGLRAVQSVESLRLGVHLDTFHMNIEEADPPSAIRLAGNRLIHFHACENDRSLPGHGHIDWKPTFAALQDIGYEGPIVMESLPGPYGSIAGRLNIWRRLSMNPDMELIQAAQFLRKQMEDVKHV